MALVTGASSGIGKAIALAFCRAGARVAVNHIGEGDGAGCVVKDIEWMGGEALAIEADVTREDQVVRMFQRAVRELGTIDILVNNAGIQRDAPFLHMTLAQWNEVLAVNLTGYFLCAREAAREFVRRGVVRSRSRAAGNIICISSVHEFIPWSSHCNYAASKGGVSMLMKSIAQELAPYRIRVNGIAPGAIKTPINRWVWQDPQGETKLLGLIPWNRIGFPEDVAAAAVWLASDDSEYVHGATLFVDGGMCLYPGFAEGG